MKASEVSGDLYRLCRKQPPVPDDFAPHVVSEDKKKRALANANPADCNGWGLSVYLDEDDLRFACELNPKMSSKKYVYKAAVVNSEGKIIKSGGPGHYTFWPREGVDLHARSVFVFGPVGKVLGFVD